MLEIIEITAPYATAFALLLALYQTWDARATSKRLTAIHGSVSTKVIGPFPDYLRDLAAVLARAEKSVSIVCAYPEHAHFSNPEGYREYQSALTKLLWSDQVAVELIVASPEVRLRNDRQQFQHARTDWHAWAQDNHAKLDLYIRRHNVTARDKKIEGPVDLRSAEDWHRFQEDCEQAAIQRWRDMDDKIDVVECNQIMPMFMWIIDGKEAVFTIMGYNNVLGYAIRTFDQGVIEALESLKERYRTQEMNGRDSPTALAPENSGAA